MATSSRSTHSAKQQTTIKRTTPIAELPQFLTVEEFAAYLKVGRALAYELANARGVRVGRLLRVPREALQALVGEGR